MVNTDPGLYDDDRFNGSGKYTIPKVPIGTTDNVNSPAHYTNGQIEAIDYIKDTSTKDEYIGFLSGSIKKYMHRWKLKGGKQDLEKAQWFLDRLIKEL